MAKLEDDYPPDEPPPSYQESMSSGSMTSAPTMPPRPSTGGHTRPQAEPSFQDYSPPSNPPPRPRRPQEDKQSGSSGANSSLYSNNSNLPFEYPRKHLCNKCKNTGWKKNRKICSDCWKQFYLKNNAYSPNPKLPFKYPIKYLCTKCENTGYEIKDGRMCEDCWKRLYLKNNAYNPNKKLPFKYPRQYLCDKCENTGYKLKNGKTCKDCWERFNVRVAAPPNVSYLSTGPIKVRPGDPRIGGELCYRCRGSGIIGLLLFDEDYCPVCYGVGRIFTSTNPAGSGYYAGPTPGPNMMPGMFPQAGMPPGPFPQGAFPPGGFPAPNQFFPGQFSPGQQQGYYGPGPGKN